MTTAAIKTKPGWQADVTWEARSVPMIEETVGPDGEIGESPEGEPEVVFLKVW